ncbi:putative nucleic acid-binding protein, contains PIN domain [Pleurocapsa sp. PCC 7327]|uniref:type II toxin-antitoxin system VapC family toxin n=1 Tax=Pleurocapsa sp. PCC 7327 TaxID=118163 RepID=UPI00029FF463|nr:type II toxin-antitoxin system VapC family toxin [Pleurocapsa sp. PCC 7327]AFY78234.1 putative nucleic acid-binding protein, contains PIN domain [Pleurocapsa sp. PCC 7327]
MNRVFCLDTSVLVSYLVPDEHEPQADTLVLEAVSGAARLVAPAFAWAEIGSVLRKKIRMDLLTAEQAQGCYEDFCNFPIDYINEESVRMRSWELAQQYQLPTLYDASFLAVAESESAQFWTIDRVLLDRLSPRPAYVHELGE